MASVNCPNGGAHNNNNNNNNNNDDDDDNDDDVRDVPRRLSPARGSLRTPAAPPSRSIASVNWSSVNPL